MGGCFTPTAETWTSRVLAQGGLEFMDVLSYHIYWSPPMTEPETAGAPLHSSPARSSASANSCAHHGQVKPIYMTEGGIRCPPFASWLPAGRLRPQRTVWARDRRGRSLDRPRGGCRAGARDGGNAIRRGGEDLLLLQRPRAGAMPWFSTMANGYYVLLDYDGRPKPTMMAYSALESCLGDAKPAGIARRDGLSAYLFERAKGSVAVAWSARPRPLPVPRGVSVRDLMGNEMKSPMLNANEPVYVVAPELKPDATAKPPALNAPLR